MIGTIRKHSSWLWWVVAALTIISFIWWGASPATRNGSGSRGGGLGTIYGKPITQEEFVAAKREFFIYYWRHYGEFPDRSANVTATDMERETYVRLMLKAKAAQLGIRVSEESQQAAAIDFLKGLGRDGQAVPMSGFVDQLLTPEGLTAADFQRFIVDDLAVEQLIQTLGLSGALVPPQEAGQLYDREHQKVSAQAVFFSVSNYLSQVSVTPAAVGRFYTNYLAHYRLPDRITINYLEYDLTNYLAAAEQKIGRTNITAQAEAIYAQKGAESVPDASSPQEAKQKLAAMILRQGALSMASEQAKQFLNALFAMEPASPDNLVKLAKTDGLAVHTTAPFTEQDGPLEFSAAPELTKTAFKLSPDSPFSIKPILGGDTVYIIGLASQVPSEIPPLSQIQDQVMRDFQNHEAAGKARTAGTNFYYTASVQMASGKTFAQATLAAGQTPVLLQPFSLSSEDISGAEQRAEPNEIKRAAFTTQPGHISPFEPTAQGGFVLFVQSLLPVDESAKKAELPRYLAQLRRSRQNEAFNVWLEGEANRELQNTPIYQEMMKGKSAPGSP